MGAFPPPCALTSHQPPALMVAELLEATADGGRTRLLNPSGLDALQLTEGCAQSLAVILGNASRSRGGVVTCGMLVSVKQAVMTRAAAAGEAIDVSARRAYAWDSFLLYRASASTVDGSEIFSGEFITSSVIGPP